MDTFHMGELFWVLALTVPVLVVLLALCIDCRDKELDMPPIGDYEEKPRTTVRTQTFRVLRYPPSPKGKNMPQRMSVLSTMCQVVPATAPPFSSNHSLPDMKSLPSHSLSFIQAERDDDSVPSYENEVPVCNTDDEENYFPGYIEVLPDVPIVEQRTEDHTSTDSLMDQYENMPQAEQHSPGDYVNVLEPEATISDPCFGAPLLHSDASHFPEGDTSGQESDEDIPDYENVCPGV